MCPFVRKERCRGTARVLRNSVAYYCYISADARMDMTVQNPSRMVSEFSRGILNSQSPKRRPILVIIDGGGRDPFAVFGLVCMA